MPCYFTLVGVSSANYEISAESGPINDRLMDRFGVKFTVCYLGATEEDTFALNMCFQPVRW